MVKAVLIFIFNILLFFPLISLSQDGDIKKMNVGVILPLSGEVSSLGTAFRNGMTLALEELSEDERKLINFIYEDDAFNSRNSISALKKLQSQNRIDVAISFGSGTSNALAPIVERDRVALIAIASDPKVVKDKKYVFNFWVTPEQEAEVMVPEAIRRGYKKVARICAIHDGTFSAREALDLVNENQIQFVVDEEYPPDAKDFRTYLTKIKARKDIDAILPLLFPGQISEFTKQARSLGITLPFFSFEFFEDANEVKNANGTLEGAWYVNADDASGDFVRKFKARFPTSSMYSAANGYDTVKLLISAAKRDPSAEGVRFYLSTLSNFEGALGKYSASGDQRFTLGAAVKEITKDGFIKIR